MTDPQLPITNVYAFPRLWDTICAAWGGEVFFADLADEIGGPVLELAVGTGRLLAEVASRGHKCAGLDLSPDMIDYCRKRLPKQQFVVGDMLEFDLGKKIQNDLYRQQLDPVSRQFGKMVSLPREGFLPSRIRWRVCLVDVQSARRCDEGQRRRARDRAGVCRSRNRCEHDDPVGLFLRSGEPCRPDNLDEPRT